MKIHIREDLLREAIGMGVHTGLRKAADSEQAHKAWVNINNLPEGEWDAVIQFTIDALISMASEVEDEDL